MSSSSQIADRSRLGLSSVILAALIYASFYLILCLPVWTAGRVLAPEQGHRFFWPLYAAQQTILGPHGFTGSAPGFAEPEMMSFYPVSVIGSALGLGYSAFVLLALVVASTSCFLYARRLTGSVPAAAVAGTIYGASGFLVSEVGSAAVLHTACWFPLLLLGLEELRAGSSARWFVITAGVTGLLLLGGSLQIGVYGLLLAVLVVAVTTRKTVGQGRLGIWALLSGIGIAAIQLVPAVLAEQHVHPFRDFVKGALGFGDLINLLLPPHLFSFAGGMDPHETVAYVGLLPLLLAGIGLVTRWRHPGVRFWGVVAVVGILLALGDSTPLAQLTYVVPLINQFGGQSRHLFELSVAVSILAAYGIAAIERDWRSWRRPLLVAVSLGGLIILGGWLQLFFWPPPESWLSIGIPVLVLAGAAGAYLVRARDTGGRVCAVVIAVIVLDLGTFVLAARWSSRVPGPEYLELVEEYAERAQEEDGHLLLGSDDSSEDLAWMSWEQPRIGHLSFIPIDQRKEAFLSALVREPGRETNRANQLLQARYAVVSRQELTRASTFDPVDLGGPRLGITLGPGCASEAVSEVLIQVPTAAATHVGQVTTIFAGAQLDEGTALVEIRISGDDGQGELVEIQVGRDTGEWATGSDRAPQPAGAGKPTVWRSSPATVEGGQPFIAQAYGSLIPLARRRRISSMRLRWVGPDTPCASGLHLVHLALLDEQTRTEVRIPRILAAPHRQWALAEIRPETLIYRHKSALPAAWFVSDVRQRGFSETAKAISSSIFPGKGLFDPRQTALTDEPVTCCWANVSGTVTTVLDDAAEMRFEVDTLHRTFLVVSRRYASGIFSGWRAWIDGRPEYVYRASGALLGITIPTGSHQVRLEYFSPGPALGGVVSLVSVLAAAAVALFLWRKRRRAG